MRPGCVEITAGFITPPKYRKVVGAVCTRNLSGNDFGGAGAGAEDYLILPDFSTLRRVWKLLGDAP
jgi:hypothetical protein